MLIIAINQPTAAVAAEHVDDSYKPLTDVINDLLDSYWEEANNPGFLIQNLDGEIAATLVTVRSYGSHQGMVAVTTYGRTIKTTVHQVAYVFTDGLYTGTNIQPVAS